MSAPVSFPTSVMDGDSDEEQRAKPLGRSLLGRSLASQLGQVNFALWELPLVLLV